MNKKNISNSIKVKLINDVETYKNSFKKGSVCKLIEYPLEHSKILRVKLSFNEKILITTPDNIVGYCE